MLQEENGAKSHTLHLEAWHTVRKKTNTSRERQQAIPGSKQNEDVESTVPPSIEFLQVFQLLLHYLLPHFLLCQVSRSKLLCGEEMLLRLTSLCSITPSHTPAHNPTSLTHLSSPTQHSPPPTYT